MKTYEEMAKDVLHRIDAYEAERRFKRARMARAAVSVTPVCAAAAVGVGLWKFGTFPPAHEQIVRIQAESAVAEPAVMHTENSSLNDSRSVLTADTAASETASAGTVQAAGAFSEPSEETENSAAETDTDNAAASPENSMNHPDESSAPESRDVKQTVTKAPKKETQTAPPASQTEAVTQVPVQTGDTTSGYSFFCIWTSFLKWNGVTYTANEYADISAYTKDQYLGKVGDFEGTYGGRDTKFYLVDAEDSVYTVRESSDILLVVKAKANPVFGGVIAMTVPNGDYVRKTVDDSGDYEDLPVYN